MCLCIRITKTDVSVCVRIWYDLHLLPDIAWDIICDVATEVLRDIIFGYGISIL